MDEATERSAAEGFAVNVDSVYNESAAVDAVLKEMSTEIIAPPKDMSFNDFVENCKVKLDEAGLQTIIDEVNRQYEAFTK